MAKRVLEESESINIELMIQSDSLAKKKSCKEKHDPESKEYQRSAKVVNGEKEIDTKELRKERKQLKKVKKLGTGENFDNESTVQPLSLGDTSVKNTRKAEKAKREADVELKRQAEAKRERNKLIDNYTINLGPGRIDFARSEYYQGELRKIDYAKNGKTDWLVVLKMVQEALSKMP